MDQTAPSVAEGSAVRLACPAKINLALSVGGRDPSGYHPVATWMVGLELADTLTLNRAQGPASLEVTFADDALGEHHVNWAIEKDLAWRAMELLEAESGQSLGVRMTLSKRIPPGGGLGGGSSDAAGVLVGLNRLFELKLTPGILKALASRLGADVPFFVGAHSGTASAIGTGYGEHLNDVPHREPLDLVLFWPGFGCPTSLVYKYFDDSPRPNAVDLDRVLTLTTGQPVGAHEPFNDLAEPACRVEPRLGEIRDKLSSSLDLPVHITGSGSTLYAIARSAEHAHEIARNATESHGIASCATRSLRTT